MISFVAILKHCFLFTLSWAGPGWLRLVYPVKHVVRYAPKLRRVLKKLFTLNWFIYLLKWTLNLLLNLFLNQFYCLTLHLKINEFLCLMMIKQKSSLKSFSKLSLVLFLVFYLWGNIFIGTALPFIQKVLSLSKFRSYKLWRIFKTKPTKIKPKILIRRILKEKIANYPLNLDWF